MCRTAAAAFVAAAAAVALSVAPAAVSAQAAPVHAAHAHALTARDLMARSTLRSAAARLARSPYTFPSRANVRPATSTPGNLSTSVAVSATNVWAIGYTGANQTPLAEHYKGKTWKTVPMPTPTGSTATTVSGLAAISASDVWAVGNYLNASGDYATLSEHWNGTKWTVVATPNQAGFPNNYLYAVSGTSANNLWAVGTSLSSDNMVNTTLVEHWNGKKWAEATSPNPNPSYDEFQGVQATSATGLLAVGSTLNASGAVVMFAETYDGTNWTELATPLPSGDTAGAFGGLAAISATSALGFGWVQNASDAIVPLAEKWNGTKWTVQSTPNPPGAADTLMAGAAAESASDMWLAGGDLTVAGTGDAVIEHWNGTAWSVSASPNPSGATDSQFTGVAAPSATSAWAVGETNPSGSFAVLREHWNGTKWTINES
ncbi:MAG TPA: hypothetical protein VHY58_01800 [Streptosporangiaceae bacterium]|nr:hypothetical protein [Streptosporangiaceae bacterium]